MTAIHNPSIERLKAGQLSIGVNIKAVRGVEVPYIMKSAGFDWLFIDLEHGPLSVETAYQICVSALGAGVAPIVRVPNGEYALATRCLDGGALGIVMPHVDTPEEAKVFAGKCRFPPQGHRSIAGGYAQLGYAPVPAGEAMPQMNDATQLVVMLETPRAIDNADAIAAVAGIDVLLIGANDLALEMGIAGQLGHARMIAAAQRAISACAAHSKTPAVGGVYDKELLGKYVGLGMRMIVAGSDLGLLFAAAREQASFVRSRG